MDGLSEGHLALGAASALLTIYLVTGHVLPDTAVAKAQGFQDPMSYLPSVAGSFAAALSLGLGLLLMWVISAVIGCLQAERPKFLSLVVVNLALPGEVFIAMSRGQALQGVRYFLPALVLMVAWNLSLLEGMHHSNVCTAAKYHPRTFLSRTFPRFIWGLAAIIVCEWGFESYVVKQIIGHDSSVLQEMRSQHLQVFAGRSGVAADIGFISYFSGASICDMKGLVNGRQFAAASADERAKRCAESSPDFAYVTIQQGRALSKWIDLENWNVCHAYRFRNGFHDDDHYLLVRPAFALLHCPTAAFAHLSY